MDFYNCPYVDVILFRNGNEYDEAYRCGVTGASCHGCQRKLMPEEYKIRKKRIDGADEG